MLLSGMNDPRVSTAIVRYLASLGPHHYLLIQSIAFIP